MKFVLTGAFGIALIFLLFLLGANRRPHLDRVSEWPVTSATILESDVKEFAIGDYSGFIMHICVRLKLQYKVANQTFETVFTNLSKDYADRL